jgi:hypothetical protein
MGGLKRGLPIVHEDISPHRGPQRTVREVALADQRRGLHGRLLDHGNWAGACAVDDEQSRRQRKQHHGVGVANTEQPAKLEEQRNREQQREIEPRRRVRQVEVQKDRKRGKHSALRFAQRRFRARPATG